MEGVILAHAQALVAGLWTALPGRIESYDSSTGRATVTPLVATSEVIDGERVWAALPPLPNVPVQALGDSRVRVKLPHKSGDPVILVFMSCSIDRWKANGGRVDDPGDGRRNSLSDAVAFPGGFHSHPDNEDDPLDPFDDVVPIIEFTSGGQIHAGGSDALATKADVQALANWVKDHYHDSSGGPTSTPTSTGSPASNPAADEPPDPDGTSILKGS
jgi:hypothetical protein